MTQIITKPIIDAILTAYVAIERHEDGSKEPVELSEGLVELDAIGQTMMLTNVAQYQRTVVSNLTLWPHDVRAREYKFTALAFDTFEVMLSRVLGVLNAYEYHSLEDPGIKAVVGEAFTIVGWLHTLRTKIHTYCLQYEEIVAYRGKSTDINNADGSPATLTIHSAAILGRTEDGRLFFSGPLGGSQMLVDVEVIREKHPLALDMATSPAIIELDDLTDMSIRQLVTGSEVRSIIDRALAAKKRLQPMKIKA